MRLLRLASLGLLLVAPLVARAEDAGGCTKFKWSVAREKTAFASSVLPTIASGGQLPGVMEAATLKLQAQSAVTFPEPPARKPKVDPSYAAVVTTPPLAASGTYQVTLSAEAWIDVLQDGKSIKSAGFSGQPDCTGVRKSVKFPLQPGPLTVQISGAAADTIMVELLPSE